MKKARMLITTVSFCLVIATITALCGPLFASASALHNYESGTQYGSHGNYFEASAWFYTTGTTFEDAAISAELVTGYYAVSLNPVFLTSVFKVKYAEYSDYDPGIYDQNDIGNPGSYSYETTYRDDYLFKQDKLLQNFKSWSAVSLSSDHDSTMPTPIESAFSWEVIKTLNEIFNP